jgi:hypothetical protein
LAEPPPDASVIDRESIQTGYTQRLAAEVLKAHRRNTNTLVILNYRCSGPRHCSWLCGSRRLGQSNCCCRTPGFGLRGAGRTYRASRLIAQLPLKGARGLIGYGKNARGFTTPVFEFPFR